MPRPPPAPAAHLPLSVSTPLRAAIPHPAPTPAASTDATLKSFPLVGRGKPPNRRLLPPWCTPGAPLWIHHHRGPQRGEGGTDPAPSGDIQLLLLLPSPSARPRSGELSVWATPPASACGHQPAPTDKITSPKEREPEGILCAVGGSLRHTSRWFGLGKVRLEVRGVPLRHIRFGRDMTLYTRRAASARLGKM